MTETEGDSMEKLDQHKAEAKRLRAEAWAYFKTGISNRNPKYRKMLKQAAHLEELVANVEAVLNR